MVAADRFSVDRYQFFFSMWIYGCSLILLAFVMSSFFTEAKTMFIAAAIMLIIFSVITYLVELLMIRLDAPYLSVLATFTFSPIPFGHLLWTLSSGELMGRGWEEGLTRLEWNIENDYYYEAYFFLVFDCFLYIGLTLFLDSLVGDPLSFGRGPKNSDGAEQPTPGMGISVKNLSKLFKWTEKDKTNPMKKVKMEVQAVDGLNLDVEENMICCLLGHNGAGKTTSPAPPPPTHTPQREMICVFAVSLTLKHGCKPAMKLLAGLEAPDSGMASVGGFDVVADREVMRQNLGMCPQHDILYDELTNMEQLLLYGSMQGLSDDEAISEANRLLEAVGLTSKAGDLACQMSGGQRRRLSLAVSLIGNPRVSFLVSSANCSANPVTGRPRRKTLSDAHYCCRRMSRPLAWTRTTASSAGSCCSCRRRRAPSCSRPTPWKRPIFSVTLWP